MKTQDELQGERKTSVLMVPRRRYQQAGWHTSRHTWSHTHMLTHTMHTHMLTHTHTHNAHTQTIIQAFCKCTSSSKAMCTFWPSNPFTSVDTWTLKHLRKAIWEKQFEKSSWNEKVRFRAYFTDVNCSLCLRSRSQDVAIDMNTNAVESWCICALIRYI